MLLELHIKNFALINSLDIEFDKGLNILTGETGAGKSILIDSVNFILGEKQTKDIIRIGENSAFAEAVFDIKNDELTNLLDSNGIEAEDILVISREININGKSVSRVNGRTITLSFLKQLSGILIDIHGQHEHQSLLDEDTHIKILDSFCKDKFTLLKSNYRELYYKVKDFDRELIKLKTDEQAKLRQIDLLKFQIEEISDARLKENEDEELKARRDILANSEKIYSTLAIAYKNIYEGDENPSAFDQLGTSITGIETIDKYDRKLNEVKNSLSDIYYRLEDIIEEIRNYRDSIDFNSEELSEIEFRLDQINKLKRKYGNSVTDILSYYDKICTELEQIEKSEEYIDVITQKREEAYNLLIKSGNEMSVIRKKTALNLKDLIENELKDLGMEKAVFDIIFNTSENVMENGIDLVRFAISSNPGEPPRALSKVASGGEMSRIMLAVKSVIADIDRIPTLIFDEIDIGISGRTAQSVAEKMAGISGTHQILCVTHLPQIAAMADSHFKIEKIVDDGKTYTRVFKLKDDEQYDELARILGGVEVTGLTRKHAEEMIKLARSIKDKE